MPPRSNWHDQWIEVDADKGKPHVRGTTHSVEEIQEFWRRPGVGAAHMRKQVPDLSEAQLGAAVTWVPPYDPPESYVAESEGPPRRRLYLFGEPGNWMFVYTTLDDDGSEREGGDFWEEEREAILRYPEEYAQRDTVWRNERSGDVIDIYSMKD